MQGYIGPFGALVGFMPFKSAISSKQGTRSTFETTLGGFVSEFRGPRKRRTWSVSIDGATYAENAQVKALIDGFYGDPPWTMALPYQQVTNMLTPAQSILEAGTWAGSGFTEGGAVLLPEGTYAGRSIIHLTGGVVDFGYTEGSSDTPPVLAGKPIAWSAYVRGAGNIQLQWLDYSGAVISTQNKAYNNPTIQRVALLRTPPAGAVRPRIWFSGVRQAAAPAFTWTNQAIEWVPGNGANFVTVGGIDEDPDDNADFLEGWRDSAVSFEITELR